MRIGILGTGMVARTIGSKLVAIGHDVKLGSRTAAHEAAAAWAHDAGARASHGTFADAAAHGELLFNCTAGTGSLQAVRAAGAANLDGKVLVDVSNPLESSPAGMRLFVANDDSLGERIQREHPEVRVVKTLNTVNCAVMVEPARVAGGVHDLFLCGDDDGAKRQVTSLLREWFGWKTIHDLGGISAARALEAYVLLWVRLWGAQGTADFNVRVAR